MNQNKTLNINGTEYDPHTGMPIRHQVAPQEKPGAREVHPAANVHGTTQKSTTLHRRYVQSSKPEQSTPQLPLAEAVAAPQSVHTISKFGPDVAARHTLAQQPRVLQKPQARPDIAPIRHAAQIKHQVQQQAAEPRVPKPAHVIKQEVIAKALAPDPEPSAKTTRSNRSTHKKQTEKRKPGIFRFATAGVALLLVAGYFSYLSMPNLSVRIAAAQAGVDATYPSYKPSGYSLSGPVAYKDGSVTIAYAANGTNEKYTISQTNSSWDSTAVEQNYVRAQAGEDFSTTRTGGLTIYTYNGNNAAWVNGGILYTISGDTNLSPDQISRIATSM